jgi:putative FmdB family regulatory protein
MPLYDYECKECGYRFEQRQKMSDAPIEVCPKCGGTVERLISAGIGLIFKGAGFHATEYHGAPSSCSLGSSCCSCGDKSSSS